MKKKINKLIKRQVKELEFKNQTPISPQTLAEMFHSEYEKLAPKFGYETRDSTKKFDPNSPNGQLMIETCKNVLLNAFGYDWDYFENNDNVDDLICEDCGAREGPPFDEGDECICGGKFRIYEEDEC